MPTTRYDLTSSWSATNRITAVTDTAVYISGVASETLKWAITNTDTAPSFIPSLGHSIREGDTLSVTVAAGERLWLATIENTVPTTITTGVA